MNTPARDFIAFVDEPPDGQKVSVYMNLNQIRTARMEEDGTVTIRFSEAHVEKFLGIAATALAEHLAQRSRVLDGSALEIERRVAIHLTE